MTRGIKFFMLSTGVLTGGFCVALIAAGSTYGLVVIEAALVLNAICIWRIIR